jgi:hypothetical protein
MLTVEQESRSTGTVAYNIHEAIPKEYTDFRNSLTKFIRDLSYKSPEMLNHTETWLQLDAIMKTYIRTIDDADFEWKRNAIDIYTGKMK